MNNNEKIEKILKVRKIRDNLDNYNLTNEEKEVLKKSLNLYEEEIDVEIAKLNNVNRELYEEGINENIDIVNVPTEKNTSKYKEYASIYKLDIVNIVNSLLEKIVNNEILNDEKQVILLSLKNYLKSLEYLEILKQNNEHYDSIFTK